MTYLLIQLSNDALHHLTHWAPLMAVDSVAVSFGCIDFWTRQRLAVATNVARWRVTFEVLVLDVLSTENVGFFADNLVGKEAQRQNEGNFAE